MDGSLSAEISLAVAIAAAIAALVSAFATVAMSRLTSRLANATESYVNLVQEQLHLLRAQLEAPLLLHVELRSPTAPVLFVRRTHSGSTTPPL